MSQTLITEKPILVTGAGGWVGAHCVYQLLDRGYKVRGTVRDVKGAKYQFLKTLHPRAGEHLELVAADLLSDDGWDDAVKGVDYILHVASPFVFSYKHEDEVIKPAVEGVERVMRAAFKHDQDVRRIVLTSSVCAVVYGHSSDRYGHGKEPFRLFTEEDWSVPENMVGYEKSKVLSERRAWDLLNDHNKSVGDVIDRKIELTTICPGFVFGPILDKAHSSGESSIHVKRVLQKAYPFVPPIDSSHVDVRDVAKAHILAMEAPSDKVAGERFLVASDDGNMTFVEQGQIFSKIFKPYGFCPATTVAPSVLVSIGKYFLNSVKVVSDKVGCKTFVSNQKATDRLGMTWIPIEESFKGHGLTLMQFDALSKRKTPSEVVDGYKAY